MKKLYYVRHGESFINIEDVFASRPGIALDKGLTDTGKRQALDGARSAQSTGLHVDHIVCSTSRRARETARVFADHLDIPAESIEYSDLFIELQFGELEGTSWSAYWESEKTYKDLHEYEGAESIEMLQKRAEKALAYLESLPYDSILVVSHSAFGRAFRRVIMRQPPELEFTMSKDGKSLPHGEVLEFI